MKQVIEGRIEGRRGQGRPRQSMLHELMEGKEESYVQMKRKPEDRELWRRWIPGTCFPAEH